jgi:energy-coupling factor transporter ATP-binding protein EcfA2
MPTPDPTNPENSNQPVKNITETGGGSAFLAERDVNIHVHGIAQFGGNSSATQNFVGQNAAYPDVDILQEYLAALEKEFAVYEDPKNIIPLHLQPGKQTVPTNPVPLASKLERLRKCLNPHYSPTPPPTNSNFAPDKEREIVAVEDFVKQNTRVALLGAPGAGKSTTLRSLAKAGLTPSPLVGELVTGRGEGEKPKIPIFVELNRWQDPKMSLIDFMQSETARRSPALAERLPMLMQTGQVLLLLDALNEIPQLNRYQVATLEERKKDVQIDVRATTIADLAKDYPKVQCLLTCRVKDFPKVLKWHDLHVLDLTEQQVRDFALTYYEDDPQANELTANLIAELYHSPDERKRRLQFLVAQPFYLVRLLLYYYETREIPANPALLFIFSIDEAFQREIDNGFMTEAEADELQTRLSYLAFSMTDAKQIGTVKKNLAADLLFQLLQGVNWWEYDYHSYYEPVANIKEAEHWFKLAQSLNILTVSDDNVTFQHQFLQELFTVLYLQSQSLTPQLLNRISYPLFKEVWRLWNQLNDEILPQLITYLKNESWIVRYNAAESLGVLGDLRAVEPLLSALQDEKEYVRSSVTFALGQIHKIIFQALKALLVYLLSEDSEKRGNNVQFLGNLWFIKALPYLEYMVQTLQSPKIVEPLYRAIAEIICLYSRLKLL